jgi:hypothetical protein
VISLSVKPRRARPKNGALMEWIKAHVEHLGNECLTWPFSRLPDGRINHMTIGKKSVQPTRVMCELAQGPSPSDVHHAAHSCGKAHEACINPQHLRWATPKENEADKLTHGTKPMGDQCVAARLNALQAREIYRRAWSGELLADLAAEFEVHQSVIGNIRLRRTWKQDTNDIQISSEDILKYSASLYERKAASARNAIAARWAARRGAFA